MTLAAILEGITDAPRRFTVLPDKTLDEWALYAIGVFNRPAPEPAAMIVEIIARELAQVLHDRLAGALNPSPVRMADAFKRVAPNETDEMYSQLSKWCEVISFYMSELS